MSGKSSSVGRTKTKFPIWGIILESTMHVINEELPILLSLSDINPLGIYLNNLRDELIQHNYKDMADIERFFGYPFIRWDPVQQSFFTVTELKRLHKRFGHPHSEKLFYS